MHGLTDLHSVTAGIRFLKRRGSLSEEEILEAGGVRIDKAAHSVQIDGKEVELSFKEFELLWYFWRIRA